MLDANGKYHQMGKELSSKEATHQDVYFYLDELKFVWDKGKNESNVRKHGIDFRTAALVFNDPYALTDFDYDHSDDEVRHIETGIPVDPHDMLSIPGFEGIPRAFLGAVENVLLVVYTMRYIEGSEYHRIISARAAEEDEIKEYEAAKLADY